MFRETAQIYYELIKPEYVDKYPTAAWIENVLDGSKEKENEIYSNSLFLLQKDYRMNSDDLATLHCLALP